MPAETLPSFVIPTFDHGGGYESDFQLNNTIVLAQSSDRNPATVEPHKPEIKRIELAQDLITNPDFKEAGYDVAMEMGRLFRDINKMLVQGKTLSEAINIAAGELEVNIRTYDLEIIKQRPVLPHLNRFGEKDGKLRLVGNNGEPVVNAITAQERNGAVLEASRSIENFMLTAENNSFAVLMNPAGWNGFVGKDGQDVEPHLNAETMIFWKGKKGDLKGLTLVTDLKEDQARKTTISLGVSEKSLEGETEQERLVNLVKNPALLSLPEAYINPFEYVLEKMLAQRGTGDFRLRMRDGSIEIRSINGARTDIKQFEELLLFSMEEENLVIEPGRFISAEAQRLGEKSIQQEIINKIEKAILMLTRKHLKDIGVYRVETVSLNVVSADRRGVIHTDNRDDFAPEIMFLKSRAGCPASMITRTLGGSSLGSVASISGGFVESDQYGSLEFQCPKCKQTNKRSSGQLIPNCQHCNANVRC